MEKELADVVVRLLPITFEELCSSGDVPEDRKKVNVTFMYKKGLKED